MASELSKPRQCSAGRLTATALTSFISPQTRVILPVPALGRYHRRPPRPAIATGRDTDAATFVRARGVRPCPATGGRSCRRRSARTAATARHQCLRPCPGDGKGEREVPSQPRQRGPFLNASVRQRRGGEQVPEELSLRSHSPFKRDRASCRLTDPRDRRGRGPARRHK